MMNHAGVAIFLSAAVALLAPIGIARAAPASVEVSLKAGRVRGAVEGDVLAFRGIPYAAPPVGPLRWRPPQSPAGWTGVREAVRYGHDCMQKPFESDAAPLGTTPSEDCLVVNVWRPAKAAARPRPVMVWIYGGGFVNGGSSPAVYAGDRFARHGVVLVSFNYRLGRFGFFAHPALTREHPDEPKGDYGLMDQIAALKWVRDNIAAFGGDPANVTVFGESAGGASVSMLMASPLAQGLFQKAIIESGGGRDTLIPPRPLNGPARGGLSAEELGLAFARRNNIEGADAAALERLRALPAEAVVDGLNLATMFLPNDFASLILDGRLAVESPEAAYGAGRVAPIPVLVGANSADLALGEAATLDEALAPLGTDRARSLAAYDPDRTGDTARIRRLVAMDRSMSEPARYIARSIAALKQPAYTYRFSYVADSMRDAWRDGAPHATEIPFVFDTAGAKYGAKLTTRDRAVAATMIAYWTNFARHGDPNGRGLPPWPRYDAETDQLMDFRPDGSAKAGADPWRARLDLVAAASEQGGAPAR